MSGAPAPTRRRGARHLSRRRFGATLLGAAGTLALSAPRIARGKPVPRVVIVGGGVGGLAAARQLSAGAAPLDVTVVEAKAAYTTCFFSNLHLAGLRSLASLTYGYAALAALPRLALRGDRAVAVDPATRAVALAGGDRLAYDRLILAPGIDFDLTALPGYDEDALWRMPHAWIAGAQTGLLRHQLETMADGGTFVIAVPGGPMRCPPAPYERACLVAHYFKQAKPRSKILILDGKDSFVEQDLFQEAWYRHYPGMIEWLPGQFTGGVKAVEAKTRTLITDAERFKADVANVIPPQRAGMLAQQAGVADGDGWCPVDPLTFESRLQPGIHIVGDAARAGAMPKSASAAKSQGEACATAIVAALTGKGLPAAVLRSDCFAFLAPDDAVRNQARFAATPEGIASTSLEAGRVGESAALRAQQAQAAAEWYAAMTRALFG